MDDFKHCDEYINDSSQPICLRKFLRYCRWPATYQSKAFSLGINKPVLFADFHGKRVRVVMASRFGDVGITKDLTRENGYEQRVYVEHLSNFSTVEK